MFYAHYVLNKKGPLARIWLAAHWDKKLTKANVFETNIEKSVEGILQPKVKLALRTSGHLMLGVVRIYSKKEKYLLADCNEAFLKIKMAFRPGMVDLPAEKREAAVNAITLPEVFHDFDTAMPELNDVDIQAQFSFNQSRAEEITMREDYGNMSLMTAEDGFGDMGFDSEPPELMRDASELDPSLDNPAMMFDGAAPPNKPQDASGAGGEPSRASYSSRLASSSAATALQLDAPIRDDGFGGHLGQDIMAGGLFDGGLFDEPAIAEPVQPESLEPVDDSSAAADGSSAAADGKPAEADATAAVAAAAGGEGGAFSSPARDDAANSDDDFGHYDAPPSPMAAAHSSDGGSPSAPQPPELAAEAGAGATDGADEGPPPEDAAAEGADSSAAHDQTTLVRNEDETFALPPIDTSTLKGLTRTKRKRKLIVDEVKNISGEEMKSQLSDTSDIVTTLDLAPPTKRLMHWKETGGVEKLFALPTRGISAASLSQMYARHLTSRPVEFDEFVDEAGGAGAAAATDEASRHQALLEQFRASDGPHTPLAASESPQQRAGRRKRRRDDDPELEPTADDLAHQQLQLQQLQLQQQLPSQTPVCGDQTPASVFNDAAATPLAPPTFDASLAGDASLPDAAPPTPAPLDAPGSVEEPASVYSGGAPGTPWHHDDEPDDQQLQLPEEEQQQLPEPDEEQEEGETDEQFEDRVNNRRAAALMHTIRAKFDDSATAASQLPFSTLCRGANRKQVSQRFYTTLVLKKLQVLHLEQEKSYSEILLTRGVNFSSVQL